MVCVSLEESQKQEKYKKNFMLSGLQRKKGSFLLGGYININAAMPSV